MGKIAGASRNRPALHISRIAGRPLVFVLLVAFWAVALRMARGTL